MFYIINNSSVLYMYEIGASNIINIFIIYKILLFLFDESAKLY